MDNKTKKQRHDNMARIHNKDTKPEILLRKALWKKGIRYRKNYKELLGKPDIVVLRCHLAIFVDGDFWHGNPAYKSKNVSTNKEFWVNKINKNIERDKFVNEQLTEMGWIVLRFWESDIKTDINKCMQMIEKYIV